MGVALPYSVANRQARGQLFGPMLVDSYRRLLLRRFPYGVVYVIVGERVIVYSIALCARIQARCRPFLAIHHNLASTLRSSLPSSGGRVGHGLLLEPPSVDAALDLENTVDAENRQSAKALR